MLWISNELSGDGTSRIRLEGKLREPWSQELRRLCAAATAAGRSIYLDLRKVTFADAAAAGLLRELIRQGAVINACSGFVAALLEGESQ